MKRLHVRLALAALACLCVVLLPYRNAAGQSDAGPSVASSENGKEPEPVRRILATEGGLQEQIKDTQLKINDNEK